MGILRFFARHGTAANLLLMAILAFGIYAATQIRTQYFPDVVSESVTVDVDWDGASPEEIDEGIIQVATPDLLDVEGVTDLEATARNGSAEIELTFEPGWDMDRAVSDVKSAMPSDSDLPDDADTPVVARSAWRDTVLNVVLSGDLDRDQMERLGEELESKLKRAGVTRATLRGVTDPEISVIAKPDAVNEYGLTLSDLADAVTNEVDATSAGTLDTGGTRLRTGTERRDAKSVEDIVVQTDDYGAVPLSDLATVDVDPAGSGRAYYLGNRPAVQINVQRGAGGDAIKIMNEVKTVSNTFLKSAPPGLKVDLIRNRAAQISARLDLLVDNGVFGLVLVLALLYFFLSPSAALWVAAGIPVSVAAGLGLMWLTGQSLNMISLFALILCLGIIVDDAIVVAEHADHRHRFLGERRGRAAERGAIRMLGPVLASTVTTVVAFLSIEFVSGKFGVFISSIPFVVAAVLTASLIECFLILPHHLSHGLAHLDDSWVGAPARFVTRGFDWMRFRIFQPAMRWVIRLRYAVLLIAVAALIQAGMMIMNRDVQWRFFQAPSTTTLSANIAMRDGATRADTEAMLAEVNRAANVVRQEFKKKYGADPVTYLLAQVGGTAGPGLAVEDDKDTDLLGAVTMELIDADKRPYDSSAFITAFQKELKKPDTLESFTFRAGHFGPGGDSLSIMFSGPDLQTLKAASLAFQDAVADIPEITSVEDDVSYSGQTYDLALTGYGRALGFDTDTLSTRLKADVSGVEALSYVEGLRDATIEVEFPEGTITPAYLDDIRLQSPTTDEWVRLGEIVTITASPSVVALRRQNGQTLLRVTGDLDETDAAKAEAVKKELTQTILPTIAQTYGVSWQEDGLAKQESQFLSQAVIGVIICLLGIYMTLALVLGKWAQPLTIMAVIPFGIIGVVWGHYWSDLPMSLFSVVGMIGLSGIIVNDSIVLLSAIGERLPTRATIPAVIDATSERLRPVLLTTLTTVLGLAPLLLEKSSNAAFLQPMVVTLVYGLSAGFFLVLLLVPSLVVILHDISRAVTSARFALKRARRNLRTARG